MIEALNRFIESNPLKIILGMVVVIGALVVAFFVVGVPSFESSEQDEQNTIEQNNNDRTKGLKSLVGALDECTGVTMIESIHSRSVVDVRFNGLISVREGTVFLSDGTRVKATGYYDEDAHRVTVVTVDGDTVCDIKLYKDWKMFDTP